MTRATWEYLVLTFLERDTGGNEKRLTNLGSEGWEIVAVAPYNATHTVYMKRQKP